MPASHHSDQVQYHDRRRGACLGHKWHMGCVLQADLSLSTLVFCCQYIPPMLSTHLIPSAGTIGSFEATVLKTWSHHSGTSTKA